jgi:hypothetical protein
MDIRKLEKKLFNCNVVETKAQVRVGEGASIQWRHHCKLN